jgi:hypothetical protein
VISANSVRETPSIDYNRQSEGDEHGLISPEQLREASLLGHGQVGGVSHQQQQQSISSGHDQVGGYYTQEQESTKIVVPKMMASLWEQVNIQKREEQEKAVQKMALRDRGPAEDLLRSAPDLDSRSFTLDDDDNMSTYSSPSPPPVPCFSSDSAGSSPSSSTSSSPSIFTFPTPVQPQPHQFSIPITLPDGTQAAAACAEFVEEDPDSARGEMETGTFYICA